MSNNRTVVQVVALETFRTSGLPDGRYAFPNTPLVLQGETLYMTQEQVDYVGPKVKLASGDEPDAQAFRDYAAHRTYDRGVSPMPHRYEPGSSTLAKPTQALLEARLEAAGDYEEYGSPTGSGGSDSPLLKEDQPTSVEGDVEEFQRTERTEDVTNP